MRLTPHEILMRLGFEIPQEGVTINPADAFLITEALRLAGATLDVERISDADLEPLHHGLAGLAALRTAATDVPQRAPDADSLLKLRSMLSLIMSDIFRLRDERRLPPVEDCPELPCVP